MFKIHAFLTKKLTNIYTRKCWRLNTLLYCHNIGNKYPPHVFAFLLETSLQQEKAVQWCKQNYPRREDVKTQRKKKYTVSASKGYNKKKKEMFISDISEQVSAVLALNKGKSCPMDLPFQPLNFQTCPPAPTFLLWGNQSHFANFLICEAALYTNSKNLYLSFISSEE